MDIIGIKNIKATQQTKNLKKVKSSGASGGFSIANSDQSAEIEQTPHTQLFSSIDALFLNLETQKKFSNPSQIIEETLDQLEHLKDGITLGKIKQSTLKQLILRTENLKYMPQSQPELKNLMLEVETRLKVELAKLEMQHKAMQK